MITHVGSEPTGRDWLGLRRSRSERRPAGTFEHLSAGAGRTCAIESDGPRARAAKLLSNRTTDLTKAIVRYRKVLRAERAPPPDPIERYF